MRIAIASGKGGTGKTTLATSIAAMLAAGGRRVAYVDADVEEPNGHLFLRPRSDGHWPVERLVPEVDDERCTSCGACGKSCRFSAILPIPGTVLTFPAMCHGCGGCVLACPTGAIHEVPRRIGLRLAGTAARLRFVGGRLDVGEAMSPPVIRDVLRHVPDVDFVLIDAPPGTACPVLAALETADVVLLVTEPTPFGLHDLRLAVEVVRALGLPLGVAVNRAGLGGDAALDAWCEGEEVPILLRVPDDREIARGYARGRLALDVRPELASELQTTVRALEGLAAGGRGPPSAPHKDAADFGDPAERPSAAGEDRGPGEAVPGQRACGIPESTGDVRELVLISGKGGTGKTSILASFAALAGETVIADVDVDAADLHLVLRPRVRQSTPFSGGAVARVDPEACVGCGVCAERCRFDAIAPPPAGEALAPGAIDVLKCEGCGVCVDGCPVDAISLVPTVDGAWYRSETDYGPMVHARLGIARENSGRLVSEVRKEARAVAERRGLGTVLVDGPPGIGCPVISAVTGAYAVLIVTEPTPSGRHDLRRVAELVRHFDGNAALCINKADLSPGFASQMVREARELGLPVLGQVRYDDAISHAQVAGRAVVEVDDGSAAQDIRALWARVRAAFGLASRRGTSTVSTVSTARR